MLKRYGIYNGSVKCKVRNPYYNNRGSFVHGLELNVAENKSAHQNVTCFDGNDGSITVAASGGVPPYIYSMNSDFSDYNTTGVFSGLSITGPIEEGADEYGGILICGKTIYAKDANNNTGQVTVKLQSPVELEWLNCPGNIVTYCDEGQNYATVVFTPPSLSTYANYSNISVQGVHTNNRYNASQDPYTISYVTYDRCKFRQVVCPITITVLQGNPLVLTEDISAHADVTCFDGNNGSITVQATGGQSPYVYSMDSSFTTYNSTGIFDNLFITGPVTEGTDQYGGILMCTKTFYVKDTNNVISSVDVQLKSPVELYWETGPEQGSEIIVVSDEGENFATITPGLTYTIPTPSTIVNNPTGGISLKKGHAIVFTRPLDFVESFDLDINEPDEKYSITYQIKATDCNRKLNISRTFCITVVSRQ